jgi:hypothetical protein
MRILLKADVSEAGEGWSDSTISAAVALPFIDALGMPVFSTRSQALDGVSWAQGGEPRAGVRSPRHAPHVRVDRRDRKS